MADYSKLERAPYKTEDEYFRSNPHVGGMATEDDRIIINPYSKLKPEEKDAVRMNEASRILMRRAGVPKFQLSDQQAKFLDGTEYAKASDDDRRATVMARHFSGDPSVGQITDEQAKHLDWLKGAMKSWLGD